MTVTQNESDWKAFQKHNYREYLERMKITDQKALKIQTLDSVSKMDFLLNRKQTTTQKTSTVDFESQRSFTVNVFHSK